MKKYTLLLIASLLAAPSAHALTAAEQLKAMKNVFIEDFHNMDDNGDGSLSLDEYLSHQFENFRANILEADGFDQEKNIKTDKKIKEKQKPLAKKTPQKKEANQEDNLAGVPEALDEMANFDFDFDDDPFFDDFPETKKSSKLTKEDVMPEPEIEETDDIDLSLTEEETLKNMLNASSVPQKKELSPEEQQQAAAATQKKQKQIAFMMDTIKKTLPKKIDEITTWTNIDYKDNKIVYLYQADVDTTSFKKKEKEELKMSIESQACAKAYAEMCPTIKTMFLKDGINMQIRYVDKVGSEIGFCEINEETCK